MKQNGQYCPSKITTFNWLTCRGSRHVWLTGPSQLSITLLMDSHFIRVSRFDKLLVFELATHFNQCLKWVAAPRTLPVVPVPIAVNWDRTFRSVAITDSHL